MILKIDVDSPRGRLNWRQLEARARIVHLALIDVKDERSPSGQGWHRLIEVRRICGEDARFTAKETVFLQLLFGSDPIREAFNWHRARLVDARQVARFWRSRWNVLYSTTSKRRASPRRGPA
jgi:hypothetical protein